MARRITGGSPEPLGATPTRGGLNVAVFSQAATGIDLCLFDSQGREVRIPLPERTGDVFHGHFEDIGEGTRYGLRAHGPFAPMQGHRFDASKLLLDPYAAAIDRAFVLDPAMLEPHADTAAVMPKAIVLAPAPPTPPPITVPWERTVIYEAHVRGLTMRHPAVPEAIRGTFAALAQPAVTAHLKALGVTTLELLPAAAWIDERHLPPLGLTNYWGYNSVAFCAPDPRLAPGGWAEVRAATTALAAAGIETILDVVFNHSGEGDALGPTLCLRGLDNAAYYRLHPEHPERYIDDSGTGDTLALDRPQGVRLAMEALRTWVRRGGMAGFRFDLAPVLGRRPDGFDPHAPLLAAIDHDPELRGLKLIAEPWDCGPGGYQLGRFPGAWGEWNDGFRDTVRRFWRGDGVSLGALAGKLAGSQDVMAAHRRPSRSVNFVTAHDGFTLADLVSYAAKHNEANGEQNRDGSSDNASWNNGVEGPTEDRAIKARRAADQRALLATLMLARGTPMLSMGAELGQTQGGNNNAYCQDNHISWIAWDQADRRLVAFVRRLGQARAAHPALHADRFLTGRTDQCPWPDVAWMRPDGVPMQPADWDDPHGSALQMVLTALNDDGAVTRAAVLINRGEAPLAAVLPESRDGQVWTLMLDSADDGRQGPLEGQDVRLAPRSVALAAEIAAFHAPRGASDDLVAELAARAGIAPEWWSLDGACHHVTAASKRALLAAMGLPAETSSQARDSWWRLEQDGRRPLPACRVARLGEPLIVPVAAQDHWLTVEAEDGRVLRIEIQEGRAALPDLPLGRHRLRLDSGAEGRLIVAPRMAYQPPALDDGKRLWGLSAQLYGVRRAGDQGMGDFVTLGDLAEGAAARGAGMIGLNPLHALFPADRERASPYHPCDRRFIDPLYLDVEVDPDAAAELRALPAIDYPAVWALKSKALEAGFGAAPPSAAFDAFVADAGPALNQFAAFQTIAETWPGRPWQLWPAGLQDPRHPAVAAFVAARAERMRYHQYLQWLCDRQLAAAAGRAPGMALGFCRDLAVGAAPDGAEAWAAAGRLAMAASIGAPPDELGPSGQVWGLPPPIPRRWAEEGYDSFAELLRANMRHAGALRIDHVLGLARLFWVPGGAAGADGAYVAYPLQDLLGVLALESVRAQCLVVGEDLGTVPDGLRGALGACGVLSYKVLPFERDGPVFRSPASYPVQSLACVATHDLPPLAGWWSGADLDERAALGLLADVEAERARRAADKAALLAALAQAGLFQETPAPGALTPALAGAIHAYVAASPAALALAQVEDLAGETQAVNLPGTDSERPNWRRRIETTLEQLWDREPALAIVAALKR
jgi:glycogen operon protein